MVITSAMIRENYGGGSSFGTGAGGGHASNHSKYEPKDNEQTKKILNQLLKDDVGTISM